MTPGIDLARVPSVRDPALYTLIRLTLPALSALITGMLTIDPSRRMTLADVFAHPWVVRYAQSHIIAALKY